LLKLYLNDVGILSGLFYRNNISAIMSDDKSVNLGSVYETVVAQELKAHGYNLYYYDNKKNGEVDYLIDDVDNLSNIPIEVKSGKDYTVHSALNKFLTNDEYNVKRAYVLSNEQKVYTKNGITYIPIYYVMFFQNESNVVTQFLD
jgi:predicted AAA+ superfamily ATPase